MFRNRNRNQFNDFELSIKIISGIVTTVIVAVFVLVFGAFAVVIGTTSWAVLNPDKAEAALTSGANTVGRIVGGFVEGVENRN